MKIGIPKESKTHEYRVGITPDGAKQLVAQGHEVFFEKSCGKAIGYTDADYQQAGAIVTDNAVKLFESAKLIVKVKEPQPDELSLITSEHTIFAYLHLAADKLLLDFLLQEKITTIAYETITDTRQRLPLLTPMSEVAGRLATQFGARYLEKLQGGHGVLLGAVTGTEPANVIVLGAGIVGRNAAEVALGMGARVTVFDISADALSRIDKDYGGKITVAKSSDETLSSALPQADLVIGAVLVPGGKAPCVVSEAMVKSMKTGSVIVDVAIDQGGCFATSKPTSHDDPVYICHGVTHFCVTNIPSAVAYSATTALTHATLPYIQKLAGQGVYAALKNDRGFLAGLNTCQGHITHQALADCFGKPYHTAESIL